MERKILYLDPDKSSRNQMQEALEEKGYEIELSTASTLKEAEEKLDDEYFNVLVTEYNLDKGNSEELLVSLGEKSPGTVSVLFSKDEFGDISEEAIVAAHGYTDKKQEDAYKKIIDQMNYLMRDRSEVSRPKPEDEESRLKAIERYNLDDMMESDDFENLAKIGAEIFDTKFCFVGIVSEGEEEFLSFQGSDTETLERDCTICTFTINQEEVMEVEDTDKDPRFKYVDEIHDLGIKWYAGAPIVTEDGYRIGAFCVADPETRELSARERRILQLLADEAMERIEIYRKKTVLQRLKDVIQP